LKSRDDQQQAGIRWVELLEKFRAVQERARRATRNNSIFGAALDDGYNHDGTEPPAVPEKEKKPLQQGEQRGLQGGVSRSGTPTNMQRGSVAGAAGGSGPSGQRPSKVGLGLGRFAGGAGTKKTKR